MIRTILYMLLMALPFILFALLNMKANLKKPIRHRQFLMPIFALIYCIVAVIFLQKINDALLQTVQKIPAAIDSLGRAVPGELGEKTRALALKIDELLKHLNLNFWIFYISNAALMLIHVILKRIVITFLRLIFKKDNALSRILCGVFYEYDDEGGYWYVKDHYGRMRTFLKVIYLVLVALSVIAFITSSFFYQKELLTVPYYPVFAVILVGELYFVLDGLTKEETEALLGAEADRSETFRDYASLRKALKRLFADKLNADDTTADNDVAAACSNDELLSELENSEDFAQRAYGAFMRKKTEKGMELDQNYLASGRRLLCEQSVLFNDPFYRDLMPYAFFPLNRVLLRHGRGLIVLGRHGMEQDAKQWCIDGLSSVTNIPSLWSVEVLTKEPSDPAVGILTFSAINDIALLEANRDYFRNVEFVMILEPSRLITTAQLGLNTIVRFCREERETPPVFCSADKNCDGLVDALAHVLMTDIHEVSATGHHTGTNSYMCWEADNEAMQHRMLPNISRFLGFGTELSFAALRQQIPQVCWYGGEAFPVTDMHWIADQYYYDLLNYANLPATQKMMDEVFRVSPDMWSAPTADCGVYVVEDESYNMFEARRAFATRAKEQGFINVLSTPYLLRDYMSENCGIFSTDPKAIPYVTADYARTERNVALRLCLRLCAGFVPEQDIRRELMLLDAPTQQVQQALWDLICRTCGDEELPADTDTLPTLVCGSREFTADVLQKKDKFSLKTGKMETLYFISDSTFGDTVLADVRNAEYIAEDENGDTQYLGSELMGQVFQKRLPGQFFTFCGRYYEMLRVSAAGKVVVRRAADHITGRPTYRQERNYFLSGVKDSEVMGDYRNYGRFSVRRQSADIRVQTPAYWNMERYNDFETGIRVEINGVPERCYRRKQLLKIDFAEAASPEVIQSVALLFGEVLRSMFAENQDYLSVVTPAGCQVPLTCSICGEDGTELSPNAIYVIEDSRMDMGLLVAVERNLKRIFEIICDYLLWHGEAMEKSLNPPPAPEPKEYAIPEEQAAAEEQKKKGFFGAIGGFFKKIFTAIKNFFAKLFGKKPKAEGETAEKPEKPKKPKKEKKKKPGKGEETVSDGTAEPAVTEAPEVPEEPAPEVPEEPAPETPAQAPYAPGQEPLAPVELPAEEAAVPEEASAEAEEPAENEDFQPLLSRFFAADGAGADAPAEDISDALQPEAETPDAPETPAVSEDAELSYEQEKLLPKDMDFSRKPYHERYYLLYGGTQMPAWLDIAGVSELLEAIGCANNYLTQARKNRDAAEFVEKNFVPNRKGVHYCDFCGCELTGTEFDMLADGRERCIRCGKTAVRTADEFKNIYKNVIRNMDAFFGVRITKPVRINMVNANRLHKALGQSFVPTGNADGRILGVAIKSKEGYTILMENGAPALQSTMTMVHELTHIWQYLNWDSKEILRKYGKEQNLEVYEGMAKWVEIQYAYLINEAAAGKREEIITKLRNDEYGKGFLKYLEHYPLSTGAAQAQATPFDDPAKPL